MIVSCRLSSPRPIHSVPSTTGHPVSSSTWTAHLPLQNRSLQGNREYRSQWLVSEPSTTVLACRILCASGSGNRVRECAAATIGVPAIEVVEMDIGILFDGSRGLALGPRSTSRHRIPTAPTFVPQPDSPPSLNSRSVAEHAAKVRTGRFSVPVPPAAGRPRPLRAIRRRRFPLYPLLLLLPVESAPAPHREGY